RPRDLAREFKATPFRVHSPDLQAVLDRMRSGPVHGKYLFFMTRPHAEWTLARMAGDPPWPELFRDQVFSSLEAAEWAVFRLRWKALTGREADPQDPAPTLGQAERLPARGPAILAYVDPVTVAPGETVGVKVSCHDVASCRAD